MSAIDILEKNLQRLNQTALANICSGDISPLQKEFSKLKKWIGDGAGSNALSEDRIIAALGTFYTNLKFDGLAQARLVCFGCTQTFGPKRNRLIEDRQRFMQLLDYVDKLHDRPRPFRKCYRGLLNAYFSYDPDSSDSTPEGRQSWEGLREFLNNRKECTETPDFNPEWVTALFEHCNLLTKNPCQPYGLASLDGDRSAFNDIRDRLEISDDSWLIRHLVDAQVDAAIALPDTKFKPVIDRLLKLISEHELLADAALSKLINRYAECEIKDIHSGLRDFSVAHWKNPWLPSNAARWGSVRSNAKEMVASWLKLELIGQFFSLLAEDGSNDTRRVEFWKQYHNEIDDMYFALGPSAMHKNSRDFKEIRKAMEGRLLQLYAAGAPTNNAFIMMIGDYAVVEFGSTGNAAFIFNRREQLPFKLTGDVAGDLSELKNHEAKSCVKRLVHRDTNEGKWEDTFRAILHNDVGVQCSASGRSFAATSQPVQVSNSSTPGAFSDAALIRLASEQGFIIKDNRNSGGALWVNAQRTLKHDTRRILQAWGFRWSERREAFYKKED